MVVIVKTAVPLVNSHGTNPGALQDTPQLTQTAPTSGTVAGTYAKAVVKYVEYHIWIKSKVLN